MLTFTFLVFFLCLTPASQFALVILHLDVECTFNAWKTLKNILSKKENKKYLQAS